MYARLASPFRDSFGDGVSYPTRTNPPPGSYHSMDQTTAPPVSDVIAPVPDNTTASATATTASTATAAPVPSTVTEPPPNPQLSPTSANGVKPRYTGFHLPGSL